MSNLKPLAIIIPRHTHTDTGKLLHETELLGCIFWTTPVHVNSFILHMCVCLLMSMTRGLGTFGLPSAVLCPEWKKWWLKHPNLEIVPPIRAKIVGEKHKLVFLVVVICYLVVVNWLWVVVVNNHHRPVWAEPCLCIPGIELEWRMYTYSSWEWKQDSIPVLRGSVFRSKP